MGGEGSMLSAIKSLRANRDLLKKRSKRNRTNTTVSNKEWINHKHATPQQLEEIRNKVHKQQKTRLVKVMLVTLVIIVSVIAIFYFSSTG